MLLSFLDSNGSNIMLNICYSRITFNLIPKIFEVNQLPDYTQVLGFLIQQGGLQNFIFIKFYYQTTLTVCYTRINPDKQSIISQDPTLALQQILEAFTFKRSKMKIIIQIAQTLQQFLKEFGSFENLNFRGPIHLPEEENTVKNNQLKMALLQIILEIQSQIMQNLWMNVSSHCELNVYQVILIEINILVQ
ncbi:unnamed protein product [Paramecium octaurelia]|uniref:Uncharacterized protein n=1 Tax=Paramecium octaurelia TaxID=43137 RepID=A0A8S1XJF0_PAROT|nr:unnamed protein product [Paramecium octaurelia]